MVIEEQPKDINVVNLDEDSSKVLQKTQPLPNLTHESMCLHNFFSMFHLLAKLTKEK
jgi:hypothetical protein